MASSFSCNCEERKKPVEERAWVVTKRNCHYSAFNGYKWTYSEWSTVQCRRCNRVGRTKAAYVKRLKNA